MRLLVALLFLACADSARAQVVFDPPTWSAPAPLLRGGSVSGQARLVNRGAQPATIGKLTFAGPVYARTAIRELGPGESAPVSLWLNAPDAYGPVAGEITYEIAGQAPARLRLRAVVGRASEVGLLPREVTAGTYPARAGERLLVRFFFQPGCEHCAMVLTEVAQPLARYFAGAVDLRIKPTNDMAAFVELQQLRDAYRLSAPAQTHAFVGRHALTNLGVDDALYRLILAELAQPTKAPALPPASRVSAARVHEQMARLGTWAAVGVGLVDGINPCALATIVFLIALLTRLGHRRRTIAAAGVGYVIAVFATYTLLGLGLLRALAQADQQLAAARALRLAAAVWALAFAVLQVRDVLRLRRGAPTRELSAQLPTPLKQRAHALLRWATPGHWGWLWVGLATAAAGVVVTLIEMACTSQVYVPVLMVLRAEGWQQRAGQLLLAYNAGFVLPLILVAALALAGTSSTALASLARRHLVAGKLALAALLTILAVVLVLAR